MQQFSRIIEFRQDVYTHAFLRARDAQFELVDALLLSPSIRSYPELSQSPAFRRRWHSLYKAMETERQDETWLTAYLAHQVPAEKLVVLPLDTTAWPHPQARTLEDRANSQSSRTSTVLRRPFSSTRLLPVIRIRSWLDLPNRAVVGRYRYRLRAYPATRLISMRASSKCNPSAGSEGVLVEPKTRGVPG